MKLGVYSKNRQLSDETPSLYYKKIVQIRSESAKKQRRIINSGFYETWGFFEQSEDFASGLACHEEIFRP